ncbi:phosphoribosylamine--glycine ligase [Agriterribacter sp.]|uniref:phosphoribosylamine--glycine ligase n=1 Tax=Agriterribacter sp. TaxID=2821509 RepID=UPI002B823A16|nr:phosphoribosylamine--glycine ligase [Agriterribacter sp.]HRO46872.1 phosphoribosylamine--glycine ligase [Agriterribacter sp.]HRQ18209.1 phosphoribosylamine--glycine ligase [Agriterribacter sp.]
MNILLLGSGGREHAFAWKLTQSSRCTRLFIAPGNAGTSLCGTNVDLAVTDFDGIKQFCVEHNIGMVVVGPEEPLVKGIYDYFKNDPAIRHIPVIGPSKAGANLEGSKAFAKAFMQRHGIPSAAYKEFDAGNYEEGISYLQLHATPIVLKADGLAAGKGVIICQNHVEAMAEFELMIQQAKFGDASKKVVVEDFLSGIELSVFVLTDGENYVLLPEAKDYKRIDEGDKGLNTGGMGAISPVPFADETFMQKVISTIIDPTISGLKKEQIEYAGFIFFGIIKVNDEPCVIEYNCRMGDPETEAVLPRLKNDLVALFEATAGKRLHEIKLETDSRQTVTIVAVSGGYPGEYEKGLLIDGLDLVQEDDAIVFHAGTLQEDDKTVTNGGRVLAVTSFGNTLQKAVEKSKAILDIVQFDGMHFRSDIGYEFY